MGICFVAISAVLASLQATIHGWLAIGLSVLGAALLYYAVNLTGKLLKSSIEENEKLLAQPAPAPVPTIDHASAWQRCLNELSFDWYWETDKHGALKYQEGAGALQMGYIGKDDIGKHWWDFETLNMTEHDWVLHRETLKQEKKFTGLEIGRRTETGAEYWIALSAMPRYVNVEGKRTLVGYTGIAQIITDYKTAQQKIKQVSVTDTLTGLPNRPFFLSLLPSVISKAVRQNTRALLIAININNFAKFNTELGILYADELLIKLGQRLRANVRDTDVVARLEGDAFIILMEGLTADQQQAMLIAEKIVAKLQKIVEEPYHISTFSSPVSCTVRCGIALYEEKDNASKLMARAHDALGKETVIG